MNRIRMLREEKNLTQAELGRLLNVQDSAVSKYETEKVPLTAETLKKLSDIFGVSVDYIICQSEERNPGENFAGTSRTLPYIMKLIAAHPEVFESWQSLSDEGKDKARDYLRMLQTMEEIKATNVIDLNGKGSNAN